jgi:aspartate racemase
MRTVGIIGGMGPQATILLMQKLLDAVPAVDDADHVPLIVHQNPRVPSRIRHLIDGEGEDPGPVLAAMARSLQAAGAQALAMPCNTAHAYAPQIVAATSLPFLDMRSATVEALPRGARIGMLASPALRMGRSFEAAFVSAALTPIWPSDEERVLELIKAVKAGQTGQASLGRMAEIAAQMSGTCDHLLIACTELSLLTGALPPSGWTDSLDCLVSAILDFATSKAC